MRCLLVACVLVIAGATARAGTTTVDDPAAWLTARGVKDAAGQLGDTCCCNEISVGAPAEHALECREARDGGHAESADIVISEVIRVVRRGKVVKVLEAYIGMQNLDWPPGSPHWIDLRVTLDRTGRAVTIAEAGGTTYSCGRHDSDDFGKWLDRVCESRGTYRWRGGRFVRTAR